MVKIYQYKVVEIIDRGHLDDPEFLLALNEAGVDAGRIPCPRCGQCKAVANGWKHREDQAKGANKQVVLLEREVTIECESPSQAPGKDLLTSKSAT